MSGLIDIATEISIAAAIVGVAVSLARPVAELIKRFNKPNHTYRLNAIAAKSKVDAALAESKVALIRSRAEFRQGRIAAGLASCDDDGKFVDYEATAIVGVAAFLMCSPSLPYPGKANLKLANAAPPFSMAEWMARGEGESADEQKLDNDQ